MHIITSAITDPSKLISLPFTLFQAFSTFGLEMFQKGSDFITEMAKVFV